MLSQDYLFICEWHWQGHSFLIYVPAVCVRYLCVYVCVGMCVYSCYLYAYVCAHAHTCTYYSIAYYWGSNGKCLTQAAVFEHLIPKRWWYCGRLWSHGGMHRETASSEAGLEIYRLTPLPVQLCTVTTGITAAPSSHTHSFCLAFPLPCPPHLILNENYIQLYFKL